MNALALIEYQAKYGRRPYWLGLLIAIDQLMNAIFWGYVDETISSRAHRCSSFSKKWRFVETVIDRIFFFDKHVTSSGEVIRHCRLSYLGELAGEHLPKSFQVEK